MNIDEILAILPDKFVSRGTTSKKFKTDLFNFFNKEEFKEFRCAELGIFNGDSTFLLCNLFKHVIGIENSQKQIDITNNFLRKNNVHNFDIILHDLYGQKFPYIGEIDIFMIDAVHTYECVKMDTLNCINSKKEFSNENKKLYFIYDDYGAFPPVKNAIDDLISSNVLSIVKKIGYSPDENFTHKLIDHEGIICVEK
jgi:hypothetical protein